MRLWQVDLTAAALFGNYIHNCAETKTTKFNRSNTLQHHISIYEKEAPNSSPKASPHQIFPAPSLPTSPANLCNPPPDLILKNWLLPKISQQEPDLCTPRICAHHRKGRVLKSGLRGPACIGVFAGSNPAPASTIMAHYGEVAQQVERGSGKLRVADSNPALPTLYCRKHYHHSRQCC